MSDNDRQENFAARLQRIEGRQNSETPAASDVQAPPKESSRFDDPPQENTTVRNTLIWLAITVSAIIGGYYGIKAIPQDLKDTIAWMTGNGELPSGDDTASDNTLLIVETDTMSDQGPILTSPAVATTGEATKLNAIAQGIALPTVDTAIGQIIPFDRNASCTLRRPLAAETLVNIRIENGLLPTPIQAFSATALSDQLMQNITAVTQNGQIYDHDAQINGALSGVDVFLTDTSAPLYLVLQNSGDGIIWNINAGPGVTVAHIAIVSLQPSGLANVDATTTFDALLVSDFVTSDDCMVYPWRAPQSDWIGMQKATAGDVDQRTQMQSYTDGFAAYDTWFKTTLGVDASTNVISLRDVGHVLHGGQPSDPVDYKSIAGQDIHIMRTDHIITGDAQASADTVASLHQQTLLAAVGGTIDSLDPTPVERESQ